MPTMRDKVRAVAEEHGWELTSASRGMYELTRGKLSLKYSKSGYGAVQFGIGHGSSSREVNGHRVGREFYVHSVAPTDEDIARILPLVVERDVIEAARTLLEEIVQKYRREAEYREADLAAFNKEHPKKKIRGEGPKEG